MELLNFLNTYPDNWRNLLSRDPYNIEIKDDGEYSILKYNMITSDMNFEIVKECRGTIVKKNHDGSYKIVCYPFRKFANYGESYADTNLIDWSLGVDVQEKIDGSLIKVFNDEGLWLVATNNLINAFSAPCGDSTFGDVFYSIIEKYMRVKDFFARLDPNFIYMFEMVHPQYNPIVIHYTKPAIYFLGRRNATTFEEDTRRSEFYSMDWMQFPKHFKYHSLYECIEAAHHMGNDEEGYVVTAINQRSDDGSFLRVKVKGDKYLELHRLRGNGPLTITKIISLWQDDSLDDFLAYFPENKEFVDRTIFMVLHLAKKADTIYNALAGVKNRRDFALYAKKWIKPIQSYFFARLDNKVDCAQTYFKQMKGKNLADLIEVKEIGLK